MPGAYLKPAYVLLSDGHWPGSLVFSRDRQTRTIVDKVAVRAANAFSFNRLRSCSLSQRLCSLAIAVHPCCLLKHVKHTSCGHSIIVKYFGMRSFKFYGKWSVQTNKQTNKQAYTHACAMQSR